MPRRLHAAEKNNYSVIVTLLHNCMLKEFYKH